MPPRLGKQFGKASDDLMGCWSSSTSSQERCDDQGWSLSHDRVSRQGNTSARRPSTPKRSRAGAPTTPRTTPRVTFTTTAPTATASTASSASSSTSVPSTSVSLQNSLQAQITSLNARVGSMEQGHRELKGSVDKLASDHQAGQQSLMQMLAEFRAEMNSAMRVQSSPARKSQRNGNSN
eukprot:TRINITY_DN23875_c0_g1_i1.p1 TRINITY_DN23875_c0_g1~~TRINITY_DN23875_c0_g1_i1.p1  ORF type:complete len:179 (-),score=18.61 TRINITY_DN23875_c0_g1_i1:636-1172(-)